MPPRGSGGVIPAIPLLAKGGDKVLNFVFLKEYIHSLRFVVAYSQESLYSPLDRRSEAYRHLAAKDGKTAPKAEVILNIPNVLTFIRLALVPIFMLLWEHKAWNYTPITCAIIFIVAALTDWLDGYLARMVIGLELTLRLKIPTTPCFISAMHAR